MPHQSVNVLLTKLTWLHWRLKRKVKGELTRRGGFGSNMVNEKLIPAAAITDPSLSTVATGLKCLAFQPG
jgi:hypothetical protein